MVGLPGSTLGKARPDPGLAQLKKPPLEAARGTAGALVQGQNQPLAEHAGKWEQQGTHPSLQPVIPNPSEGWESWLLRLWHFGGWAVGGEAHHFLRA